MIHHLSGLFKFGIMGFSLGGAGLVALLKKFN